MSLWLSFLAFSCQVNGVSIKNHLPGPQTYDHAKTLVRGWTRLNKTWKTLAFKLTMKRIHGMGLARHNIAKHGPLQFKR